ncbi:hypothetical protein EDF58_105256 [Novosphingobium sp. PhB57]|nr:hypothetical protein EDF58_105256 [Novosphingobium sp. PhB57]TDW67259.1 hypothetical protein EDF57_102143 [Novosphingobium sp. PhB55]
MELCKILRIHVSRAAHAGSGWLCPVLIDMASTSSNFAPR